MLVASLAGYAAKDKSKTVKTVIRSWQLLPTTYQADTVAVDTSMVNNPMNDHLRRYSIDNIWNGNIVSPVISRLYFDRKGQIDDVFGRQYEPYFKTASEVQFYNTTVPYSKIAYNRGFNIDRPEHEINLLLTGNLSRRLNLGMEMNLLTANGRYMSQEGKMFNGNVFGSYDGDHYHLHSAFSWSTLSNFENGGLERDSDLIGSFKPEDIPTAMRGMSGYVYLNGLLDHYYSITVQREHKEQIEITNDFGEKEMKDTVRIEHVPVMSFGHTFECNNSVRRYREDASWGVNAKFYDDRVYQNNNETRDSTCVLTIKNTLSATFEEEFNRLLKFGAKVYAYNECQRFYDRPADTDSTGWYRWTNNTFVGGSLYKNRGKWVHFGFDGDVCLLGYRLGQFQVNGHVDGEFPIKGNMLTIAANAYVKNETPTWYQQHYHSNHYSWDNDFGKIYKYGVEGSLRFPTQWVKTEVKVNFEDVQRYIYFLRDRGLVQHDGHIQLLAVNAKADITTPWINLENNVIWQHSSSSALAVPDIILYHNLYYHGYWFKKAMEAQIGADMHYFTRYYSPVLMPATGMWYAQQEKKVGNYPVLNVYANFYVKLLHLKFYVQATNLTKLFVPNNMDAMIMAGYPYNPMIIRAGLAFHFYK